jgi:hypothetical protein
MINSGVASVTGVGLAKAGLTVIATGLSVAGSAWQG